MKNKKLNKDNLHKCFKCNGKGLFCETPRGGDWSTCPICNRADFLNDISLTNIKLYEKYKDFFDVNDYQYFCDCCLIVFDVGCTHACNGCTDNIYNGHLVSKWKNKITGEIFEGMPEFDSIDEWIEKYYTQIEILEWCCSSNGLHCTKGYYPKLKYPEYYGNCSLVKNNSI